MVTWCEGYPNGSLRARYADKVACVANVGCVSNVALDEQCPKVQEDCAATWRAFLRRIQRVYHHKSREEIIDYKSVHDYMHRNEGFQPLPDSVKTPFEEETEEYRQEEMTFD